MKKKIKGTKLRPRLSVFRSSKAIYAQIIDDDQGKTLVAVNEKELEKTIEGSGQKDGQAKVQRAEKLGELLAHKALKKKIKAVVFDRGGFPYHGRIKALAQGARKGGLEF